MGGETQSIHPFGINLPPTIGKIDVMDLPLLQILTKIFSDLMAILHRCLWIENRNETDGPPSGVRRNLTGAAAIAHTPDRSRSGKFLKMQQSPAPL